MRNSLHLWEPSAKTTQQDLHIIAVHVDIQSAYPRVPHVAAGVHAGAEPLRRWSGDGTHGAESALRGKRFSPISLSIQQKNSKPVVGSCGFDRC